MGTFEVAFLGTNGSCAYNNGDRKKYGTNTLCIALAVGEEVLIFDSGSGICGLSGLQGYQGYQGVHRRLFYTHYHLDHLDGLLFCTELFDPKKSFDLYGVDAEGADLRTTLERILTRPISPIGFEAFLADVSFHSFTPGDTFEYPGGVTVRTQLLLHPGGSIGYRVEYGGKVFCCCADVELSAYRETAGLLEFIKGADMLLLDSFFDDGKVISGWGHSSWRECAQWAAKAGVKRLALVHYAPGFSDDRIDEMERKAQAVFPDTFAAADHMRLTL